MARLLLRLVPGLGAALALGVFLPAALVDRGSYLQIVGHHAPWNGGPLAIGSGPQADLRLTEAGVAPLHGWLVRSGDTVTYVHAAITESSQRVDGPSDAATWRCFERLESGDSLTVREGGREVGAEVVTLVDALAIELRSAAGQTRRTLLAATDDAPTPLPEGDGSLRSWLIRCAGKIGFSATDSCGPSFRPLPLMRRIGFSLGRPVHPPRQATVPQWLEGGWIRRARTLDNGFARVGDQLRFVPAANGAHDGAAVTRGYALYRQGRRTEPRIARVGPPERSLTLHHGKRQVAVGEVELHDGDVLSLGDTYFTVSFSASEVTLRALEKVDRFHFFPSLSAGRLNFTSRVQPLPAAAPLIVDGVGGSGEAVVLGVPWSEHPQAPPASWRLPLPRWLAPTATGSALAARPGGPPGAVRERIAIVQVEAGEPYHASLTATPDPRLPRELYPSSPQLADGGTTRLAGHLVELHARTPRFEQLFSPLLIVLALLILGSIAAGAVLDASSGAEPAYASLLRVFVLFALACIWFLLVVGVLLMSHMAAHDLLLGKADYYHRQLFYSFATAAVVTAILAGIGKRRRAGLEVPAWMGFPSPCAWSSARAVCCSPGRPSTAWPSVTAPARRSPMPRSARSSGLRAPCWQRSRPSVGWFCGRGSGCRRRSPGCSWPPPR